MMKITIALALILLCSSAANAEYRKIDMTVFGMDCAPCAHAVHVSMMGIQGVSTADVDLNTGLVTVTLAAGNTAGMRLFQDAIKKNGFTYKGATVEARGMLTGPANAPVLAISGTGDRYALKPAGQAVDMTTLLGKTVQVDGLLSPAKKGRPADTLRYKTIAVAQ